MGVDVRAYGALDEAGPAVECGARGRVDLVLVERGMESRVHRADRDPLDVLVEQVEEERPPAAVVPPVVGLGGSRLVEEVPVAAGGEAPAVVVYAVDIALEARDELYPGLVDGVHHGVAGAA